MANLEPVTRRMLDMSTAHIAEQDAELMRDCHGLRLFCRPRIIQHEYGFIVFLNGDTESRAYMLKAMEEEGFSEAFRELFDVASQGDAMLINFDNDAEQVDGLPTFDW